MKRIFIAGLIFASGLGAFIVAGPSVSTEETAFTAAKAAVPAGGSAHTVPQRAAECVEGVFPEHIVAQLASSFPNQGSELAMEVIELASESYRVDVPLAGTGCASTPVSSGRFQVLLTEEGGVRAAVFPETNESHSVMYAYSIVEIVPASSSVRSFVVGALILIAPSPEPDRGRGPLIKT